MNVAVTSFLCKLGDVAEIQIGPFGSLLHKADYIEGGVPVINPMHIAPDGIAADPTFSISEEKAAQLKRYHLRAGEVIMGRRGEMGRCATVFREHSGMICGTGSMKIVPQSNTLLPEYLVHILRAPRARKELENAASGVTMLNLNATALKGFEIPLPPLEEQRRIAGILDAADALRRRRREALNLLDTLPGAIFVEMFGDPTLNPRGLKTLPFGEFAVLERGKSKHRPRNDPELLGGPHPLVQTGDVANAKGYIERASSSYSDFGLKQSRKWPAGTLCITIAANIADGAILTFPACFPDSVVGCTVREPHHAEFIRVWLMSVKGRIEKVAPAVAQKNINLKILGAVAIIVPPEQEIQEFTAIMQKLRQDRERAVRQSNELETIFASLQSRAFAGEL